MPRLVYLADVPLGWDSTDSNERKPWNIVASRFFCCNIADRRRSTHGDARSCERFYDCETMFQYSVVLKLSIPDSLCNGKNEDMGPWCFPKFLHQHDFSCHPQSISV